MPVLYFTDIEKAIFNIKLFEVLNFCGFRALVKITKITLFAKYLAYTVIALYYARHLQLCILNINRSFFSLFQAVMAVDSVAVQTLVQPNSSQQLLCDECGLILYNFPRAALHYRSSHPARLDAAIRFSKLGTTAARS